MSMRAAKGFTLVELMVAAGIAMGLLVAVYMAVNSTQRHSTSIERKVTAQQDVKSALDLMALEIGMASYNPKYSTDLWVNPPGGTGACGSTVGVVTQNDLGIQEATANSIAIEMDITNAAGTMTDGNGLIDGSNEMIRYYFDTDNKQITRATGCGNGQPFLGGSEAGKKTVQVINNTDIPVFRYYDGAGAEIVAGNGLGNLPLAIPNIRRIEIVLAVETEFNDANTGQPKSLIYSTSVIPRNHAIQ